VIGAYIVNHYVSRPANDAPVAAISPAATKKPAEATNLLQPGVKAKGISERAMMEKSASEKPAEVKPTEKPAEAKPAEAKPAETASVPSEPRKHFWSREKPVAKAATATTPAPAASSATPVDTAAAPAPAEDHRDANDLARAAIERLRGAGNQQRTQEGTRETTKEPAREIARTVDIPRSQEAPPSANAAVRPLPPPITVATPPVEAPANSPPYTGSIRNDDPNRPSPPAEIPPPPPIDLRADASKLATHTTNMAQDVLSAAKSMFHSVLPNNNGQQQNSSSASQFTE
jgi:hypothetical protein